MHNKKLKDILALSLISIMIISFYIISSLKNRQPISNKKILTNKVTKNNPKTKQALITKLKRDYKKLNIDYTDKMVDYNPFGSYFHYGSTMHYEDYSTIKMDNSGIPKIKFGGKLCTSPTILEQYALDIHDKYLNTQNDNFKQKFIYLANKLVEMQSSDGSFRYNYDWKNEIQEYKAGWVSAMAQGQSLSVLARAYYLTKDQKYLNAGSKAINFLIKPISQGGCTDTLYALKSLDSSLKNNIFFEEFINNPPSYNLNGFMFTLLGLYDWSQLNTYDNSKTVARTYFKNGIKTLKIILPYYDLGGFSTYDLTYITHKSLLQKTPNYHAVHIQLLNALNKVTGESKFKEYEQKWISDIGDIK